jgi:hypothetical protein
MPRSSTTFQPGNGAGPGRPKGRRNKVTAEAQALARSLVQDPEYLRKLKERLLAGKLHPQVEVMLWGYAHGKPKDSLTLKIDMLMERELEYRDRPRLTTEGCAEHPLGDPVLDAEILSAELMRQDRVPED